MSIYLAIQPYDDIQNYIDICSASGGGTVFLNPGTYVLNNNIEIPSGVNLEGASRDSVIIDCNEDYGVRVVGDNEYETGTVTINLGDTEVVGTDTEWTEEMVGQSINLSGYWYEIIGFTDATHIDIDFPYDGANLSGADYTIVDVNLQATLTKLTITNSLDTGIYCKNTEEVILDNVVTYNCGVGIKLINCVFPQVYTTSEENNVNLEMYNTWGWAIDFSGFYNSLTGAGFYAENSGSATFFNSESNSNATNGIHFVDCSDISLMSALANFNTENGIEMDGCLNIQFVAFSPIENTLDGYRLTASNERVSISSNAIPNNIGYGINIVDNTNVNTLINGNIFENNTAGAVNDQGTTTLIRSNIGVADSI